MRTCYEKRKKWNGLLHHLHNKPETPTAKQLACAMRSGANLSVYSAFEKAMRQQNIREAVDALKNGRGSAAVLRNLDYIISRCASAEDLEYTAACINSENVIVMIQLLIRYAQYTPANRPRTFRFTRYNALVVHEETPQETGRRRSVISVGQAQMLSAKINENLKKALRNRLGRVYIDPEKFAAQYPDVQYLVFCNNVFYGAPFSKCFCKAGYMTRDTEDSGEVFEPKTVKSSFLIDCDSTFAYLFGIDLKTNDLIWLNMARDSAARVAGTTGMDFLTGYFHVTDVMNVYSFFEMMAAETVEDAAAAQVIVTDKDMEYAPEVTVIREYDVEKMIAFMNKQPQT